MEKIFIPGNTPSSKNSKFWTGKFLISNKTTLKFRDNTEEHFMVNKRKFKRMFQQEKPPFIVGFFFVRDSKRRFDYVNIVQVIADLMVKFGWMEDDNADFFVPVFLGYKVDKLNPGVEITNALISYPKYKVEAV